MEKNIEELTLLLMYLTSWEEKPNPFEDKFKQCWKGYDFDIIWIYVKFLDTFFGKMYFDRI